MFHVNPSINIWANKKQKWGKTVNGDNDRSILSQSCLTLYLVLFQAALWQSFVSLLLEGDDYQGDEDVDEEEREDHKVDHIEDGHFYPVAWTGTLVFKGGIHRVLQDTTRRGAVRTGELQYNIHLCSCTKRRLWFDSACSYIVTRQLYKFNVLII